RSRRGVVPGRCAVPLSLAGRPIVRAPEGRAGSTRNAYLSPAERPPALALHRALTAGRQAAGSGPDAVLAAAQRVLDEAAAADPPLVLDYLALADPETFTPVKPGFAGDALLLVAARAGATRLIDNTPLTLGRAPPRPRLARPCGPGGPVTTSPPVTSTPPATLLRSFAATPALATHVIMTLGALSRPQSHDHEPGCVGCGAKEVGGAVSAGLG